MRNLLRVSLQDALEYHVDKGLLCSNLDFRNYSSDGKWNEKEMDVNLMAILRYQRYKSSAKGFALFCRNAIVHLEKSILICVLKSIS